MARTVILDTETTGLEPSQGHRIIEIGCVEMVDRQLTGNHYHVYINPEREVDAGAREVHGITDDFLADKPVFAAIVNDFLSFVSGAQLVIHNAPFDVGFINHELRLLGLSGGEAQIEGRCAVADSLAWARKKHPGQKNGLDALCRRYAIDNSNRTLHGALLDAELLALVWLAMTGEQKLLFASDQEGNDGSNGGQTTIRRLTDHRPALKVVRATAAELEQHRERLVAISKTGGQCLWQEDVPQEEGTVPDASA